MSVSPVAPPQDGHLRKLVQQHRKSTDEPLLLALRYWTSNRTEDILLFEIVENFGANAVDPERRMFEVAYGSSDGFPLNTRQQLRLLITNPEEWKVALNQNWSAVKSLRAAADGGRAEILYQSDAGAALWSTLHD